MSVIEVFLPLYAPRHRRFPRGKFDRVRDQLVEKFGGVTAFRRSPAEGLWRTRGRRVRDEIVIYEVMVKRVDRAWWKRYRRTLERAFDQDQILIRARAITVL